MRLYEVVFPIFNKNSEKTRQDFRTTPHVVEVI